MVSNKMNLKPFILLCSLYAVVVIAAVVADDPPREEGNGTSLSKSFILVSIMHFIFSSI